MSKNKVKFQPVTITLSKKELKLLHCLTGCMSDTKEVQLVGSTTQLYETLEFHMLDQNVKPVTKDVGISVEE